MSMAQAAENALQQSQITQPGGSPFYLKATIVETTNPDSGYRGTVEEYWVSPDKWRQVVTSPNFSQTTIHNGTQESQTYTGDYYPLWLHNFVNALFDPIPFLDQLKNGNAGLVRPGSATAESCQRMKVVVGTAPAQNSVFYVMCFVGEKGLLASVVTPGYDAEFKRYAPFGKKQVAREIVSDPEPGTTITETVNELRALSNPEESLFAITEPTNSQLQSVNIDEAAARPLLVSSPEIKWPTVRGGKTSGVLSVYVSVDRSGKVREVWPLNSDNPSLDDAARDQMQSWQFKPATFHGVPVQFETIWTLAFNADIANPVPLLSNEEARKFATKIVEAQLPPGASVTVRISVDAQGKIMGATNPTNAEAQLFMKGYSAARQWQFPPYLKDGEPDRFNAEIVFTGK
jgi:TonB family protein